MSKTTRRPLVILLFSLPFIGIKGVSLVFSCKCL